MPRQIFLFSPVTSGSSEFLIRQLLDLDRESNEEITMFINSPGGSVTQLFAIIDIMNVIKSPIRTVVMGMAASAAAVIAAAGDTRLVTENSEIMIHEVSMFTMGTTSEVSEDAKRMEQMENKLLSILAKKTGKSVDKLRALTKKTDKFFSAKEAVRFGLADKVIKNNEAQLLKLSESINVEGYAIEVKKDGLSEVQLLREGKFSHPLYGEIVLTEDIFDQMIKNFDDNVRGIDISIDYTHENESGELPAACWIKSLEQKETNEGKGLFASVEFTPKGKSLISEKEYQYASADFSIDYMNESGKHFPYVLRGGTLTNRPFIKEMNPIKLSEYNPVKEEIIQMNKEALMTALKDIGVDVQAIETQNQSLNAEIESLQNKIKELNALPLEKENEISALKEKLSKIGEELATNEKEKVFNALIEAGKVTPAQKDSIFNTFKDSKEIGEFYKDAPVIVNFKAKGSDEESKDGTLTEAEASLVKDGTYTKEEIIKNRTN